MSLILQTDFKNNVIWNTVYNKIPTVLAATHASWETGLFDRLGSIINPSLQRARRQEHCGHLHMDVNHRSTHLTLEKNPKWFR